MIPDYSSELACNTIQLAVSINSCEINNLHIGPGPADQYKLPIDILILGNKCNVTRAGICRLRKENI
jgi:hypothetical protein